MRIIDPGHRYGLHILDGQGEEILNHVKREGRKFPGNVGHYCGTNTQEVLRAEIDRIKYVNNQIPHWRNSKVLYSLRESIMHLELRAAERHNRKLSFEDSGIENIELIKFCLKCGHIGCRGECH